MLLASSNLQPHTGVLPVAKRPLDMKSTNNYYKSTIVPLKYLNLLQTIYEVQSKDFFKNLYNSGWLSPVTIDITRWSRMVFTVYFLSFSPCVESVEGTDLELVEQSDVHVLDFGKKNEVAFLVM